MRTRIAVSPASISPVGPLPWGSKQLTTQTDFIDVVPHWLPEQGHVGEHAKGSHGWRVERDLTIGRALLVSAQNVPVGIVKTRSRAGDRRVAHAVKARPYLRRSRVSRTRPTTHLAPTPDHRVPPCRLDGDWTQNGEAVGRLGWGVAFVVFQVEFGGQSKSTQMTLAVNFKIGPSSAAGDPLLAAPGSGVTGLDYISSPGAMPCQGEGRGFEFRRPLQEKDQVKRLISALASCPEIERTEAGRDDPPGTRR